MKVIIIIGALMFCSSAFAQTQSTPAEQVLGAKLMREINESLTCASNAIALQAEIAKLQAKVKELEPKSEEKK